MSVEIKQINLGNKSTLGVRMKVSTKYVLMIKAQKGFIMCGVLDVKAAEKADMAAIRVTNVKTFNDILKCKIDSFTSTARELGVTKGMTGKEALYKLN